MRNNTVTNFKLGGFYHYENGYQLYRYVGNYGAKKVFEVYAYDCTDRTGTWFFRSYNKLWVLSLFSYSGLRELEIDKNGRFTFYDDITCELLHHINEFVVQKEVM